MALTVPAWTAASGDHTVVYWVFAHPDDETLAAGGAMATERDVGSHHAIILSNGEATRVADALDLSETETQIARQAEARAALRHVGFDDVAFAGLPDGGMTTKAVTEYLRPILLASPPGAHVVARGHSPLDEYTGVCGHPDHCASGKALVQLYGEGLIDDLELFRLGHFFGGPTRGVCTQPNQGAMAIKQAMRKEYSLQNPDTGRYGIGGLSVPGAWHATVTDPECQDPLPAVLAMTGSRNPIPVLVASILVLKVIGLFLWARNRARSAVDH